jgi:glycosyltransferase involved in cell wall biosynthesis
LLGKYHYKKIKSWPYAFSQFDNGVAVAAIMRGLYNQQNQALRTRFANPYETTGPDSFFSWMNQPVDGRRDSFEQPAITHLQMEMHRQRPDLQQAFPDPLGADRLRFHNWLLQRGTSDFGVDPIFLRANEPARPGNLNTISFETRNLFFNSHRWLKHKASRLNPNTRIFQNLRYLNKKYLEKALTPRPALAAPTHVPHEQKMHLPFGVNIAGYLQGEFGVGEIARASYQSITSVGVPSVLNNVEAAIYRQEDKTLEIFSSDNPYHFNLVHINADQANHFANLKGNQYFKNHHNIAYWFWELASFPRAWQSSFNQYQEIWVASSFCQASIAAQAPVPVVKMTQPVLIDPTKINPQRSRLGLPQQSFIFGFSFDYMSFIERKNPAAIIKAFQLAFEDRHDVLLLLKTTNGDQFPEQVQRLKIAAKGSNVRFINHYLAREEVINLIASLDSYVSLHRSEGLGIGMAQAMFLKKPVIATGYSGNMEFMNHNNSYLVPYKLAEIEEDHGPYKKGQHWADPDIEHAAMLMRQVYENQIRAQQIANQAAADIQASMSPTVTGRAMKERLLLMQ